MRGSVLGSVRMGAVLTAMAAGIVGLQAPTAGAAPACAGVVVTKVEPSPTLTGWSENVGYDAAGNLWVSRILENVVERRDRQGRVTARVRVESPGAVRRGPDGLLYVASGDSPINMLPGTPLIGKVLRIDPRRLSVPPTVFARGLGMPNGLAVDRTGDVYVSDGRLGVVRIRPDGSIDRAWSAAAPKNLSPNATVNGTGVNGATIVGRTLYVTLTTSASGRVLRVPLADPGAHSVAADLTAPLPGVLDDLTQVTPGRLAVASTTGQVHLVDLATRRTCTVNVGQPVTAVAAVPGSTGRLVAATESGALLTLSVR
ncbi:SMP-30/gluconolactonase/LRE family protein [Gordonia soli]|uniref:SMP-30/Gluconolactonase/LRE-like region domain-containing protein n=1 Tax=Gordonia soli NBRC 108243 TaxID=1223545 RepID=M0QGM1_9ACTN|nr:hypothetical protein [Gordonia soli]GAC67718.1 hypothetical protein GS4_09_00320 [Gordonia soli NBRC 108243]